MGIKVKDLAAMLNLSPSTISLVLNNKPGISDSTRQLVKKSVRELGYEELLINETVEKKNILFIVYRKHGNIPTSTPYFSQLFSEIIEGVESQIKARGYQLMISYVDKNSMKEEMEAINKDMIEGILVLATEMEELQMTILKNIHIPIIIMDNYMESENFDCITINNEQGVYQALKHLVEMGHTNIGYLHVSQNATNFSDRYFGYLRALELLHLKLNSNYIIDIATDGGEAVYQELKHKLEETTEMPTAFFADNDIVAICAMKVFRELEYQIPEDISIIGFDNMTLSEMLDPPLTTIQIPKRKIGMIAVNSIIDKIYANIPGPMKIEIGTRLVIRNSVRSLSKE